MSITLYFSSDIFHGYKVVLDISGEHETIDSVIYRAVSTLVFDLEHLGLNVLAERVWKRSWHIHTVGDMNALRNSAKNGVVEYICDHDVTR